MKQIVILFSVLIAFSACQQQKTADQKAGQPAGRIVYVNTDTLLNNYDMYKDVVKEFQNKQFALENELQKKGQSFQNEVALFQRRAQAGGMTEQQGQLVQQQLQKKEQDIMLYRENAANTLATEQAKKTDDILTKINAYLSKYNSDNKYDMVIGYSKGGGVLYAKEDLDITTEVLKGLNEEYSKTKPKTTGSADSTSAK